MMHSEHEHFETMRIEIGARAMSGLWLEYVVSQKSERDLSRVLLFRRHRMTADSLPKNRSKDEG